MKKNFKMLSLTLLGIATLGLAACTTPPDESVSSEDKPAETSSDASQSEEGGALSIALKSGVTSYTAFVNASGTIKGGDYWVVSKTGGTPSTTEEYVTATSSDTSVLEVTTTKAAKNISFKAKKEGTCNLVVKLNKDNTKTVTLPVSVKDSFFDYEQSTFDSTLDFSNETPADKSAPGGSITFNTYTLNDLLIKNSGTTDSFYVEGKITVSALDGTDNFPKVGVMAYDPETSMGVRFFIDTTLANASAGWQDIGAVEQWEGKWGWSTHTTDAQCRNKIPAYQNGTAKKSYTLGLLREADGSHQYFHGFVDGEYRFTLDALANIARDEHSANLNFYAGFFNFKGINFKLEDYYYTKDASVISSKIPSSPLNVLADFNGHEYDDGGDA